ncbi:hypothetical protein ABTX86_27560, partial [Streptomyces anulatus]|uniref:hypothetical protein n=1 Tax=Streptomyces anulatus TaxID=1892 RepID=UPI00333052C3
MRPSQDPSGGVSPTPIYDALYSEYRRSFRALPGDRSGEENLGFSAFGAGLFASRTALSGRPAPSGHSGDGGHTLARTAPRPKVQRNGPRSAATDPSRNTVSR